MKTRQWQFIFFAILSVGMFFVSPVYADSSLNIEIPSSMNPVGSGARAMGMGGAFIAIADDATAASWNPGGLVQIEKPEVSAVFGYTGRIENNVVINAKYFPFPGEQSVYGSDINYLSIAYPFELGEKRRNMVISLNYQRLYDFNREWIYFDKDKNESKKYTQKGALYALGLAYCVQITKDFSTGITLNYWGDSLFKNKWEQNYHSEEIDPDLTDITDDKAEFYFKGWNMNLGFLFRIGEHWTIGGILKTSFTGYIRQTLTQNEENITPTGKIIPITTPPSEKDEKLYMPLSYGIGLAYRFSDNFTLSADIYRTQWNDFELEYQDKDKNQLVKLSPISGKHSEKADIQPTTCFRLGAEYLFIGEKIVVPIRSGIFYDPVPAEGYVDDYYGFSLGSGINCKWFSLDIAYKFRFGNNVNGSMFSGLSQDVREHTVYTSFIHYF